MFVHWGRRFFETDDIRSVERDYKLEIAEHIKSANKALQSSDAEFIEALKTAFGPPNNLTFHINHSKFLDSGNGLYQRFKIVAWPTLE